MSGIRYKRKVVCNDVSDACDMLIDDYAAVAKGDYDNVKLIDVRDLKDSGAPVTDDVLKVMMRRCEQAWSRYCECVGLPRESHFLFKNKFRKKWERIRKSLPSL